jgi:hypothetical protein
MARPDLERMQSHLCSGHWPTMLLDAKRGWHQRTPSLAVVKDLERALVNAIPG